MSDKNDPKGLIQESFRIDGIGPPECRSIFLDWAISVPEDFVPELWITSLLEEYRPLHPDHPMTRVLEEALKPAERRGRRGGARARQRPS